jgi:regulator of protease activity HflC (stomatin/prohibitin superfamily)
MKAYSWSLDERPPPTTSRDKWWRFVERRLPGVVMFLMLATLVVVVLAPHMVVTVPSGQVGVLWKRFGHGTVRDPRQLRGEGLHLLLPWDKLFLYDLRIQSITDTYNAISKDGVTLNATLNIRFRLQRNSVPILHQAIGPDYTKLLGPEIASQMRGVIAEYTAEQVYSSARQEIQDKIRETAVEKLSHKMMDAETPSEAQESSIASMQDAIVLYDTLLYGIELPASVVQAINRKTEQYYIAQEYAFRIDRERRESERKAIEATGISEFQRIVSQGISDSYLRWRGVEATLQLAQSNNSKIVIIGGGKDGLPIILGNVDRPAPAPAPARARATSPAESGAVTEERSTAAAPAVPLEKMPAADLALPAEKMPSADSAKPQAAAPGTPSAAPPQEPSALFPRSLSELEALVSRALRATEATTEPPAKLPSEQQPAVAQPR